MRRTGFIFLPILLLLFATPALAKKRHVPGQFPTIQAAVDASKDGDRVIVHNKQVYEEQVVIQDLYDFQILGNGRPDIAPGPGGTAFTFIDCERVKVKGVDIDDAGSHAIVFRDCVDGRVKRVKIRGGDANGVHIEGGRTYRVRENIIQDLAGTGVYLGESASGPCRRVEVWKNKIRRNQGDGVYVAGQSYHQVRKNRIEECGSAIRFGSATSESRADRNKIYDCVGGALYISGTSNLCRYNTVRRTGGDGLVVDGTDNWLRGNEFKKTGGVGFRISGTVHQLFGNKSEEIGSDGYVIGGSGHYVERPKVKKADGRGFSVTATDTEIKSGEAAASGSYGFFVASGATGNLIRGCSTWNSGDEGWVDENPEGANEYKNNSFK